VKNKFRESFNLLCFAAACIDPSQIQGFYRHGSLFDSNQACHGDLRAALVFACEHRSWGVLKHSPVSYQAAMKKLGGHSLYLEPAEIHLGVREYLSDTANVLEGMVNVIDASVLKHQTVLNLAACSDEPLFNG
jgi:Aspartate/ornithine carbamoyltransferase, carbamoyl-P binding domain